MVKPNFVDILRNQHFECEGMTLTILERVKDVGTKGYLYLLNYNSHKYISNLKHIKDNVFIFDIRGGGKYNLLLDESKGIFNVVRV